MAVHSYGEPSTERWSSTISIVQYVYKTKRRPSFIAADDNAKKATHQRIFTRVA